jgi:rubrerythrin
MKLHIYFDSQLNPLYNEYGWPDHLVRNSDTHRFHLRKAIKNSVRFANPGQIVDMVFKQHPEQSVQEGCIFELEFDGTIQIHDHNNHPDKDPIYLANLVPTQYISCEDMIGKQCKNPTCVFHSKCIGKLIANSRKEYIENKTSTAKTLTVGEVIKIIRRHPNHTPLFIGEDEKQLKSITKVVYQHSCERVVIVCERSSIVHMKSTGDFQHSEAKDQQWNFNHLFTCEACGVIMVKSPDHCPNCGECNSFKYL